MSVRSTEPRLPLEPEEYPLYKPPRWFGCSGLTIVTLITIAAFAFLLLQVTPNMAKTITDIPKALINPDGDAELTPGPAAQATQTARAEALATPTPPIVVNPTPVLEFVQVANTGNTGVRLRIEARQNARSIVTVGEGAVLKVVGPNTTDPSDPSIVWRQVELPCGDGRKGYVQEKFLVSYTRLPCSNP